MIKVIDTEGNTRLIINEKEAVDFVIEMTNKGMTLTNPDDWFELFPKAYKILKEKYALSSTINSRKI